MLERKSLIGILIIFCSFAVTVPNAYANHVNWVGDPFSLNVGTADPTGLGNPKVVVRVTDAAANTNAGVRNTVQVTITSFANSEGIVLTLQETGVNTGIFENNDLALMSGNDVMSLSDTATITIFDDSAPTGAIQTINSDESIIVLSNTYTFGITPIFTETTATSNLYTATIRFDSASNDATNTLAASAGDFITVDDTTGGNRANSMISPNPDPTRFNGAVAATIGQHVTATYQGHTDFFNVLDYPGAGRGSGGLVAPSLVVDAIASSSASGSGNGCNGDCTPPTLGVDDTYKRIVDAGFSYNDHPTDVALYYTHYPLVTVNVGQENKAVLRIYDNSGSRHIEHVELAFGLRLGEILDESKATIALDFNFDGGKTVSTFDPENALQDIRVETTTEKCSPFTSAECLVVTIYHTFRAPLDFNIVATDVWDFDRNEWQNYYNDGVEISGDSLNPPKEYVGIYKGHQIHITETGKNSAVDANGNTWTFNKEWMMDYKPAKKIDAITSHGYDRNHDEFPVYKKNQEILARHTLEQILAGNKIQNESVEEPKTVIFGHISRQEDERLQLAKMSEATRAKEFFAKLFGTYNTWEK